MLDSIKNMINRFTSMKILRNKRRESGAPTARYRKRHHNSLLLVESSKQMIPVNRRQTLQNLGPSLMGVDVGLNTRLIKILGFQNKTQQSLELKIKKHCKSFFKNMERTYNVRIRNNDDSSICTIEIYIRNSSYTRNQMDERRKHQTTRHDYILQWRPNP